LCVEQQQKEGKKKKKRKKLNYESFQRGEQRGEMRFE
jgi:hypothetical protein